MNKCKFCQADMADNGSFCPSCGRDNTESAEGVLPQAEIVTEQPGKKPGRIALIVATVAVLIAALAAVVTTGTKTAGEDAAASTDAAVVTEQTVPATIPADGNPDDATCKGTYTVDDAAAAADAATVVATMGDAQLTNSQLRIYYRSAINTFLNTEYGYYMMMYGMLDYTQPLDTQLSTEGEMTWQQYFLQSALENWQLTQAMAMEAQAAGLDMTEEDRSYLESMKASLEDTAASYELTLEDMLKTDFGAGVSYDDFEAYQALYLQGEPYYNAEVAKIVPTDADIEAYFAENEETYAAGGVTRDTRFVDARHILVQVKGGFSDTQGNMTHTDEEWAECEAAAQAILDEYLAGSRTEERFAELANEKSEDPGSNTNGGLYEGIYEGQMVEPFETWCFDEARQYGDTGLVKTSYGYHVMYYVGSTEAWRQYAESDWTNQQINAMMEAIVENYPMEVTYGNITLGDVALA